MWRTHTEVSPSSTLSGSPINPHRPTPTQSAALPSESTQSGRRIRMELDSLHGFNILTHRWKCLFSPCWRINAAVTLHLNSLDHRLGSKPDPWRFWGRLHQPFSWFITLSSYNNNKCYLFGDSFLYIQPVNAPQQHAFSAVSPQLTEEVVLSQRQEVVRHHQSISGLQEPHCGAVQNGGVQEALLTHSPKHRSPTGVHYDPG